MVSARPATIPPRKYQPAHTRLRRWSQPSASASDLTQPSHKHDSNPPLDEGEIDQPAGTGGGNGCPGRTASSDGIAASKKDTIESVSGFPSPAIAFTAFAFPFSIRWASIPKIA